MNKIIYILLLGILAMNCYGMKYEGDKYRDPFMSYLPMYIAGEKALELKNFHLTGIVWGTNRSQAIINGKVVEVGDSILEAKVMKIDKKGVVLNYKGKLYLLTAPK
jgi:hypothetical protein